MQTARQDQYCFGIWTAELPGLLFWWNMTPEPETEDHSKIPSWSWATAAGHKTFLPVDSDEYLPLIDTDQIKINLSGTIEICDVKLERYTISQDEVDDYLPQHQGFRDLEGYMKTDGDGSLHYIRSSEVHEGNVIGIATLDGQCGADVFGLVLMSHPLPLSETMFVLFKDVEIVINQERSDGFHSEVGVHAKTTNVGKD